MPKLISRLEYLRQSNRSGRAMAVFAPNQQNVAYEPRMPLPNSLNGKEAVIIGSGVAGLTTAYELLKRNDQMKVTVLEARDRTGGRCLTLRTGDTLTEEGGPTQVVKFEQPAGDSVPYLNAGPGRIPSSHKRLLAYLREFGVPVEIYVMNSGSNLTQIEKSQPYVDRRLDHNTRGWLAQMAYEKARDLLPLLGVPPTDEHVKNFQSLMAAFGQLNTEGRYVVAAADPGEDDASDRAGYDELPGVGPGDIAEALDLEHLLESQFWKTRFYQPVDFLWQETMFQPVGGMDHVQRAFVEQVTARRGEIRLNSPVTRIDYDEATQKFQIEVAGKEVLTADYCFCNAAIPFLKDILSARLQGLPGDVGDVGRGFLPEFKAALHAVYETQAHTDPVKRFLACTTKVGWQADRELWQGQRVGAHERTDDGRPIMRDSEAGVVPIYGGISWTNHPITQVWYPSTAYHDKMGVLTGAYNFAEDAAYFGDLPIEGRLDEARRGAARFGQRFADGLKHGVAIAWQNMAYIKGGWAQWNEVTNGVDYFNAIIQGTGVDKGLPVFFIVGDQVSSLPGWQEGAVASACNALSRLSCPALAVPRLDKLPDTKLMVEGV